MYPETYFFFYEWICQSECIRIMIKRQSCTNNYRLLIKYREIFPRAVVVRQGPQHARAQVRTTTKGGNISQYLVNILFNVYPRFSIIKFLLINIKFIYSKPNNNHNLSRDWSSKHRVRHKFECSRDESGTENHICFVDNLQLTQWRAYKTEYFFCRKIWKTSLRLQNCRSLLNFPSL